MCYAVSRTKPITKASPTINSHMAPYIPKSQMNPQTLRPTDYIPVGCPVLNRFFHGGIPTGQITELVSESSCGKTQFCLQLSLSCPSIYLHSEFPFPLRRLKQMDRGEAMDRVFVKAVYCADELFDVLLKMDAVLGRDGIRLVIVDSVAALFRSEFDNTGSDLKRRASLFFKISGRLRALACKFGVAVVVTNQVVDVMDSSMGINSLRVGNLERLFSSGREVSPALGISWANCLNTRIFLSRNEVAVREDGSLENVDIGDHEFVKIRTKRQLYVVFSPYLPESSCEYVILREGFFGIDAKGISSERTLY